MDDGDEETGFETSAHELEQILPKAVFHRLSPVAGGHWRVYRQGPNEYQAVYSMRSDDHVFAISSHSVSTVVSLAEVYDTFPVHRSRSLNNSQTRRVLPQIEGLLRPQTQTSPAQNDQKNINAHFKGASAQESSQATSSTVLQPNLATPDLLSLTPGDIQPSQQYHAGQIFSQASSSSSFMGLPHYSGSVQSNIASSFLIQDPSIMELAQNATIDDDEASPVSVTDDDTEESQNDTSEDFSAGYTLHGNTGVYSQQLNLSIPGHSSLNQEVWMNSAEQNTPSVPHSQMAPPQEEAQLIINGFSEAQMDLLQDLEGYMLDDQMMLASQTMADVHVESMQNHPFTAPHSEMSGLGFSTDMVLFDENNMNGVNDIHFDTTKNIGGQ